MTSKAATALVATLVVAPLVATGAWWHYSPYVAVQRLQSAAQAGDAETVNEHVDYARLRESIKGQLGALLPAHATGATQAGASDPERAGAALGSAFAMMMVDKLVDALVRPEVVMRAMAEGDLSRLGPGAFTRAPAAARPAGTHAAREIEWSTERHGADRLMVHVKEAGAPDARRVGLVFERSGFASWRLTELKLPAVLLERAARR